MVLDGVKEGRDQRQWSAEGLQRGQLRDPDDFGGRAACCEGHRGEGKDGSTTYIWMDAHTSGVISDLDPGSFMPMAPARATPAPANSRLEMQLKKVTTCLRQCCSPSVNLALTRSTPSSRTKRPMLVTSPRSPYLPDTRPLSAFLCVFLSVLRLW